MPISGLEEAIRELMGLFAFHRKRNELLPPSVQKPDLILTTTAKYSVRPEIVFAP
jgi:hypothetical protein